MAFEGIKARLKAQGLAAQIYRRGGQGRFCDELTVGRNGKAAFCRYNYGEAAGLVFSMNGKAVGAAIEWRAPKSGYRGKDDAPARLDAINADGSLLFDGASTPWAPCDSLKAWPAGGLGRLRMLFFKR